MLRNRLFSITVATAFTISMAAAAERTAAQDGAAAQTAPPGKPTMAKLCSNCHKPEAGHLRGNFDSVAYKTQSIQVKIDEATEVLRFDKAGLKITNVKGDNAGEPLRDIKKGKEVRIEYIEKDGKKFATAVIAKPAIKVAPEKLMTTVEVEKLVALGPEKGGYLLIDARPAPKFMEGAIPTAINIPFPAFEKMTDRLPKDKNALIVYYCAGMTWAMSPNSAGRAEKLGYTNVKVYHEGLPEWTKRNYIVLSAAFLKETFIDKEIPHVLLDVREAAVSEKGFIKGAVTLKAAEVAKNVDKFPPRDKKPPIIVYDQNGGEDGKNAALALVKAGYTAVDVMTGGFDAWKTSNFPVEKGKQATTIVYVPKPRPGEISLDEFRKIAAAMPVDMLILDVRSRDEGNAGMIKGAKLVPDEEILDRLSDIPKDKTIVTHCSTGVRAEMAYHKLKEKGYNVKFLNAKVDVDGAGNFKLEKL